MPVLTLEKIKEKIDRFDWSTYRKEYPGDLQDIKSLYFHCVASDIFNEINLKAQISMNVNPIMNRIAYSCMECFLWPHRAYHALLTRFRGMSKVRLTTERSYWDDWKTQVQYERTEAILEVLRPFQNYTPDARYITKNNSLGQIPFNFQVFDHWYTGKSDHLSTHLVKHLRLGYFFYEDPQKPIIHFNYQLSPTLINQLYKSALSLTECYILYSVFEEVERQGEESSSRSEHDFDDQRIVQLSESIYSYRKGTPMEACRDLFVRHPSLLDSPKTYLNYLVRIKYRNPNGRTLKTDSVDKALTTLLG